MNNRALDEVVAEIMEKHNIDTLEEFVIRMKMTEEEKEKYLTKRFQVRMTRSYEPLKSRMKRTFRIKGDFFEEIEKEYRPLNEVVADIMEKNDIKDSLEFARMIKMTETEIKRYFEKNKQVKSTIVYEPIRKKIKRTFHENNKFFEKTTIDFEFDGCRKKEKENKILREYAREFFVYGMKDKKSYDNYDLPERTYDVVVRYMNLWFQDCMKEKPYKYISMNCRDYAANPIYMIWKAYGSDKNNILFFFTMLDYLQKNKTPASLSNIYENLQFDIFKDDGARHWLSKTEYAYGVFVKENNYYHIAPSPDLSALKELLPFFSEVYPCGVLGSFIIDKQEKQFLPFNFKQHYLGQAFDSEIMCNALYAIKNRRDIKLIYLTDKKSQIEKKYFPIKIYSSTQNGMQYIIVWDREGKEFLSIRLDRIIEYDVNKDTAEDGDVIRDKFNDIQNHIWGISIGEQAIHIELLIRVEENEAYIKKRLEREKRCGTVKQLQDSPDVFIFEADVYDPVEMFPWIRSFVGRIIELRIDDLESERQFWKSVEEMYNLY